MKKHLKALQRLDRSGVVLRFLACEQLVGTWLLFVMIPREGLFSVDQVFMDLAECSRYVHEVGCDDFHVQLSIPESEGALLVTEISNQLSAVV